jgi:hypothetical protein
MRRPDVAPHVWPDPSEPLTVDNPGGRRVLVQVATADGEEPFGFAVRHDLAAGKLTVHWAGFVCQGDDITQHPVRVPAGPLRVQIINPA